MYTALYSTHVGQDLTISTYPHNWIIGQNTVIYILKAFIRANSLTFRNSRKISVNSQGLSNDRCPWSCNPIAMVLIAPTQMCTYRRGLLRCRPSIDGQCEKPLNVGTATDTDSYAFSINTKRQREEDRGHHPCP